MEAILQSPALLATLALGLASIIYYLAKSRPQDARQLPAKMKRLAVLEVPEDFTDFSDFIHTVGNSQLGQMMVKLARSQGVTIVNMVRKEEAAELLKSLGAEHVVVTSREDWQEELKKKIIQLKVSVAFDAIGGDMTATMMRLMPEGSTSVVYGGLAGGLMNNIPVVEMIYGNKKVEAFFLRTWLTEGGMLRTLMRIRRSFALTMPALGAGGWAESQFEDCRWDHYSPYPPGWRTCGR